MINNSLLSFVFSFVLPDVLLAKVLYIHTVTDPLPAKYALYPPTHCYGGVL